MDMRIEVVVLPDSDVNRAKQFYVGLGCSIIFGTGVTDADARLGPRFVPRRRRYRGSSFASFSVEQCFIDEAVRTVVAAQQGQHVVGERVKLGWP